MFIYPTIEQIIEIVHSGGNDFRADLKQITDIHFLHEEGYIRLQKIYLCAKEDYNKNLDFLYKNKREHFDISGGGIGHMALKKIALDYFLSKDPSIKIVIEEEFMGYRPDLMIKGEKENIREVIECGNVEADKFFKYFVDESVKKFYVIPYPGEESQEMFLYLFTPKNHTRDFLIFLQSERRKIIRSILNK